MGTLFRTARPAFRSSQFFSSAIRRNAVGKRFQSTGGGEVNPAGTGAAAGGAAAAAAPPEPWLKRMWNSPIGLKTVHFWYAPFPALMSKTQEREG